MPSPKESARIKREKKKMDKVLDLIKWSVESGPHLIAAINALVLALIAVFLLIPGDQPEKTLKWIADILAKFSKK